MAAKDRGVDLTEALTDVLEAVFRRCSVKSCS